MLETIYSGGLKVSELSTLPASLDLRDPGFYGIQGDNGVSRSVMMNGPEWQKVVDRNRNVLASARTLRNAGCCLRA